MNLKWLQKGLQDASKGAIQKAAGETGDLIGYKIADKITRSLKTWQQNNSETNEEETFREKYISPKLRQKVSMI